MPIMRIDPWFCVGIAAALLLLPVRLVLAWLLAVAVHECSHYIALRLCNIDVQSVAVSTGGIKMQVAPMTVWKEIVCALAGPIGGFLLLLMGRWLPRAALCGFIHSCFNLLPIGTLDGSVALRAMLILMFGEKTGNLSHRYISCVLTILLALMLICVCFRFDLPLLPAAVLATLLIFKCVVKFPCKQGKQIVQ